MYFDVFREYSFEEKLKMERLSMISGELADFVNERKELEYEYSCISENKKMDFLPLTIWIVCIIPVTALIVLDILFADFARLAGVAMAFASGLPLLFIICLIGIIISARSLIYKYSGNERIQKKAEEKGFYNLKARRAQVVKRLEYISQHSLDLMNEKREIELFLKEKDEEFHQKGANRE